MTRSRHVAKAAAPNRSARLIVTLFILLTFGLQSYVTQTHIHLAPGAFGRALAGKAADQGKPSQDKYPADSDPANCPICQEILHTGAFVTPSAAALLAPMLSVSIVAVAADIPAVAGIASHAWRSRAPPKA